MGKMPILILIMRMKKIGKGNKKIFLWRFETPVPVSKGQSNNIICLCFPQRQKTPRQFAVRVYKWQRCCTQTRKQLMNVILYDNTQILQIHYRLPGRLKQSLIDKGRNSNTYIAVTLKEIWRLACADFIPFQANYSFTDIWFGVIWAFHNYNISSERKKQKKKPEELLSTNY